MMVGEEGKGGFLIDEKCKIIFLLFHNKMVLSLRAVL